MHLTGLAVFSTRLGGTRTVWHTHSESGTVAMPTVEEVMIVLEWRTVVMIWLVGWLGRPLKW